MCGILSKSRKKIRPKELQSLNHGHKVNDFKVFVTKIVSGYNIFRIL